MYTPASMSFLKFFCGALRAAVGSESGRHSKIHEGAEDDATDFFGCWHVTPLQHGTRRSISIIGPHTPTRKGCWPGKDPLRRTGTRILAADPSGLGDAPDKVGNLRWLGLCRYLLPANTPFGQLVVLCGRRPGAMRATLSEDAFSCCCRNNQSGNVEPQVIFC